MEEASGSGRNKDGEKLNSKSDSFSRSRDKKLSRKNSDMSCKSKRTVKRKLKPFSLGKWQKNLSKDKVKQQTLNLDREICRSSSSIVSESSVENVTCTCTGYRKTKVISTKNEVSKEMSTSSLGENLVCSSQIDVQDLHSKPTSSSQLEASPGNATYQDIPIRNSEVNNQRTRELLQPIIRGINEINITELTLALRNHLRIPQELLIAEQLALPCSDLNSACRSARACRVNFFGVAHTQVDYIHHLVPGLLEITNCSFYWGKMDRYRAEKQLDKKPEGTFLLRDSAQEEFLFSVSFRRYGRTLHARIEQLNHKFSFDSHDPNVFASSTVCGLLEHYKNPRCCMFFEPMLTHPVYRTSPFDLQHLCRSVISDCVTYDSINYLKLPKKLKCYLKEYHYKEKVRVRHLENDV